MIVTIYKTKIPTMIILIYVSFLQSGDAITDTECKRCSPGVTYSDRASLDKCQNCSTCLQNEETIYKCNVTHDTVCEHNQSKAPSGSGIINYKCTEFPQLMFYNLGVFNCFT